MTGDWTWDGLGIGFAYFQAKKNWLHSCFSRLEHVLVARNLEEAKQNKSRQPGKLCCISLKRVCSAIQSHLDGSKQDETRFQKEFTVVCSFASWYTFVSARITLFCRDIYCPAFWWFHFKVWIGIADFLPPILFHLFVPVDTDDKNIDMGKRGCSYGLIDMVSILEFLVMAI